MDFETRCVQGIRTATDSSGAVSVPIYQTATFAHPAVGVSTGYDYSRTSNPTREALERTLADLEGGTAAFAYTSGMAAVAAFMELFRPGDHLLASDDLYGGTLRLFQHVSAKNGVRVDPVDTSDPAAVEAAFQPDTRAVFVETPTNPMMNVSDIAAVAGRCRARGILLAVDNTFLTPYLQRPLELGADIVLHSGTKYLGGHNDTLAGFLVVRDDGLAERLRFLGKTTGACLAPFDSWLLIRGLKTLAVRMDRQEATAGELARWLKDQPGVTAVHYIGLPDHPGHGVSMRQASGFGAMISFETDTEETARRILERVALIRFAESLGGVETLITYPMLQTHADIPVDVRERRGITDRLLRLSVGLENVADLKADLRQAIGEVPHGA